MKQPDVQKEHYFFNPNSVKRDDQVFSPIDINAEKITYPTGADLVMVDKKDAEENNFDDAIVLLGFDEVELFEGWFENPVYGFYGTQINVNRNLTK